MKTSEHAPERGIYRSQCCGREIDLAKETTLPPCPACRKETQWALVQTPAMHPTPQSDAWSFERTQREKKG